MYRVLSISGNVRLLLSRNDVLAMAGFSVISPREPEQAPELAAQQQVDAVVIGHSVSPSVRKPLIAELRGFVQTVLSASCMLLPTQAGSHMPMSLWMLRMARSGSYQSYGNGYQGRTARFLSSATSGHYQD